MDRERIVNGASHELEKRVGMTLEEARALRETPTADDIAWAKDAHAKHRASARGVA